ncbi:MAG: aldo/keto reductase [Planctomycetes bacterium]|nr:aldo/keto reductase [Planctomycetota bacterium]
MPDSTLKPLGSTGLNVSAVGLGCWPFAGVTSLGVEDSQSVRTIRTALEHGINLLDTAFSYGADGRSDKVLKEALTNVPRDKYVLCSKVGTHYDSNGQRVVDGRGERLIDQTRRSLERLGTSVIDLQYLHQPDPNTDLRESAEALQRLREMGLIRYAGISNATLAECQLFHSICPIAAVQIPFNMLQPNTYRELVDWCTANQISIISFWVLMKGLFAGKIERTTQLDANDRRRTYPMYQSHQWDINQDFVDVLRRLATQLGWSVAQLVVRWSLERPGMTSCLVGAKRPEQIIESAAALRAPLPLDLTREIEAAIAARLANGEP